MIRKFNDHPSLVNRAWQFWQILVALATNRQTITKEMLLELTEIKSEENIQETLEYIQAYCQENQLPSLNVIVVNSKTGLPESEYPDFNAEQEKVFNYNWFRIFPPISTEEKEQQTSLKKPELKNIASLDTGIKLIGETGIDYSYLRDLLAAENWRQADQETWLTMLNVAKQKHRGFLETEDIEKFPDLDLKIIAQLWQDYSQGKFGLNIQREIWLSLGGKIDPDTELKFGYTVGWCQNNRWLFYSDLNFSWTAPQGHLPRLLYMTNKRSQREGNHHQKISFLEILAKFSKIE